MKRRARRKTRTVLDWLEKEDIVDAETTGHLRKITNPKRPIGPISTFEGAQLCRLLTCLMQPARADSRFARKRDYALALEHAYYKSLGEPWPTKKVSKLRGVSLRTVSEAVRRTTVPEIMTPGARAPWLRESIEAFHREQRKPRVGNKSR